jgi:hypothetical protein
MQRDPDLIRKLLLAIEPKPFPNQYVSFEFDGHSEDGIAYHVLLMSEGGLIAAEKNPYSCFEEWNNVRLTWHGHELLDLCRDENRWQQAKQQLLQQSAGLNFEALQRILLELSLA